MIEERKLKEVEYYNKEAKMNHGAKEAGNLADFDPFLLESYAFLKNYLKDGYQNKSVLDYGCGTGLHLPWLSKAFSRVAAIDLSEKSLVKAREKAAKNVEIILGDCEKMEFADSSFDVVFDGGTFSSLNLENTLKEIHRVLKPGGILVGIETLGHNPLTNLKRKINTMRGKRTTWARDHIFKVEDIKKVERYFQIVTLRFFHIASWVTFPFLSLPGGTLFLKTLENADHIIVSLFPFSKKYSFKIVFIFKKHGKASV